MDHERQQQSMLSNSRNALIGGMDTGQDNFKVEKFGLKKNLGMLLKYQDYRASSCQIFFIVYDYVLFQFNNNGLGFIKTM